MGKPTDVSLSIFLSGWVLLTAMGLAAPSAATDPPQQSGGVYRRPLLNNPPMLDPSFVTEIYGRAVVSQMFDGLVQFDAQLKPIPAIAEFWEASRDGRTWTFYLRHGVKFHHGREVTARDFVYTFTRLLEADRPGPLTQFLQRLRGASALPKGTASAIEGLRAVDRYTLQLRLEEPFAPLLAVLGLANAAVVPEEEVERLGKRFGTTPVGAGPFQFGRWKPNQEVVLDAFESYYGGRPFLNSVVYKIGETYEEMFDAFLKGDLDETIIPSERTDEVRTGAPYRRYQRIRKPTLSLLYIGFNTRLKPFDDKRVRQAFNYAVNREAIVREITKMGSLTATGALPPGMPGYEPHLPSYYYHPAKAKRLLAEAGYPDGVGFPVTQLWTVTKAESTKDELAAYQQYLADLGVKVELHFETNWPRYRELLTQGKLAMFRLSWSSTIPDPDDFLSRLLHSASPNNRTFYHNPRVNQLLDQARTELDEVQRMALYREIEHLVLDDAPWITQHYHVFERLFQPYVRGIEVSLLGDWAMPLKKIWFAKGSTTAGGEATSRVQPSP